MRIRLVLFFLLTLSLGFHVPSDAYAAVDTWTDHTSASIGSNPVYDVSMIDASNGVAVGTGGTIVYTADGGDTWTAATTTNTSDNATVLGVSMSDANNGVAVAAEGQIVYTADWKKTLKVLESTNQLEYIPLEEQMKSLSVKQKDLLLVQLVKQLS